MVGVTVLLTSPSRSRLRSVRVSIRWETLGISRRSSLNRRGPSPRVATTSTVHLSPIRDSKVLIVRQTGLLGSFIVLPPVTGVFLHHRFVLPPQKSAFLRAVGPWLLRVPR